MKIQKVEVFKTNVQQVDEANHLIQSINIMLPYLKVNFDLEDCDKVLRIEGDEIDALQIIDLLLKKGFQCDILL